MLTTTRGRQFVMVYGACSIWRLLVGFHHGEFVADLRQIAKIPLITPAEEVHPGVLVQRWQRASSPSPVEVRPGRRVMDRKVQADLRQVVSVCRHHLRGSSGADSRATAAASPLGR